MTNPIFLTWRSSEDAMPRPRAVARVAASLVLIAGVAATVPRALLDVLQQRRDEDNIRRLAAREGCSIDDARRLYRLARRDGYGAAHRSVFGGRGAQEAAPGPGSAADPRGAEAAEPPVIQAAAPEPRVAEAETV
jgi:hypothetical protein